MSGKTELKYIELKSGYSDNGPAWIGKVLISRSGNAVYFNDRCFQRWNCRNGNFYDVESGDVYWISGVKKSGDDRHWAGSGKITIDRKIIGEYLRLTGQQELKPGKYIITDIEDVYPVERIHQLLNQKSQ